MDPKYDPENLFPKTYNCDPWFKTGESTDEEKSSDVPPILLLEIDEEEIKEGNRLKILTPNKLLTRLTILLARIKAGNNSYKLKNEIRQHYIFFISIIKSLKNFTTI